MTLRRRNGPARGLAAAAAALLLACGGGADPAADATLSGGSGGGAAPLVQATPEDVAAEIEILGYEIGDLQSYLASRPASPAAGPDPAPFLAQAARARDEAERLAASGEHEAAAESLSAAMRHIEEVKRALGLAEEWGEELAE